MIVVTGATGNLGRRIVQELLAKMPANEIVATTRDPEKASELSTSGVIVRHGDFARPDSLQSAFKGAQQVLIVSSNAQREGGDPVAQHRGAITAAKAAGARRVVYTSHMAANLASAFLPMESHAATEALLRDAGIAWTALRNGFYAQTVPSLIIGNAASTGVLTAPADGKVSWTTHDDLAAAAAAILIDEGRFDGPTPPLVASEALDLDDVATLLSEIYQREVVRRAVGEEEFAKGLADHGVPQPVIDITLSMYRAAHAGEFQASDPTLRELIGRPTQSVRELLIVQRG